VSMRMGLRAFTIAAWMSLIGAAPALADVTLFIGTTTTPANRQARGFSAGLGLLIVAFEFEYSSTHEDLADVAPSLKTGVGNVLLQTPFAIHGVQPYFTTGAGWYSETLGTRNDQGFAFNTGGGVKISLAGPLRLRLDYRIFKLDSEALNTPSQRFYAGLNLKF
jgi:hypothetical protein